MKAALSLAGAIAFALAGCSTSPSSQTSNVPASTTPVPASSFAALLNAERAANGRGPVLEDANLSRAALFHAQDMLANDYFSHTGQNGSRFTERAAAAGYGCAVAENIAVGQQTEAAVMQAWMNSSGHRRNILLGSANEYGLGRAGDYWVLMMGAGC